MKSTKRALRRHHRQRMIQHALRSLLITGLINNTGDPDGSSRRRWAAFMHDNLAACSCRMCGNPRKSYCELTIQEKRLNEAARYELAVNGL